MTVLQEPLSVCVHTAPEGIVVEMAGELAYDTIARARAGLTDGVARVLAAPVGLPLTVDLRRVDFIDTAGQAALLNTHRSLKGSSRSLRVRLARRSQPGRALRLGALDTVMRLSYESD